MRRATGVKWGGDLGGTPDRVSASGRATNGDGNDVMPTAPSSTTDGDGTNTTPATTDGNGADTKPAAPSLHASTLRKHVRSHQRQGKHGGRRGGKAGFSDERADRGVGCGCCAGAWERVMMVC